MITDVEQLRAAAQMLGVGPEEGEKPKALVALRALKEAEKAASELPARREGFERAYRQLRAVGASIVDTWRDLLRRRKEAETQLEKRLAIAPVVRALVKRFAEAREKQAIHRVFVDMDQEAATLRRRVGLPPSGLDHDDDAIDLVFGAAHDAHHRALGRLGGQAPRGESWAARDARLRAAIRRYTGVRHEKAQTAAQTAAPRLVRLVRDALDPEGNYAIEQLQGEVKLLEALVLNVERSGFEAPLESLEDFAKRAVDRAGRCKACQYDKNHAYISRVWGSFVRDGERLSLEDFKQRLLEANRRRLLTLSRGDYVEAMDAKALRESLVRSGVAEWHFIRL